MCVCVCVMFVCTGPRTLRRMFENIGHGLEQTAGVTSGYNRGAVVEADAIGGAAVEADAVGEQQLKQTQSGSRS